MLQKIIKEEIEGKEFTKIKKLTEFLSKKYLEF